VDDAEAVALLRSGDIGGLKMLVGKYQVQATRAAYLITQDRQVAQDIVQSAFLRAYERIDQLDPARPFGRWFLRSVINDALKAAAKRKREISLDSSRAAEGVSMAESILDPSPGPEDLLASAETCQMVADGLAKLSPSQRAALVLRYYLCMPEAEIAERLTCSLGTVKWHLHVARKRLRELLGTLRSG
jgi:RNA polymerase sigma-70 factor (ECF subfamily)